MTDPKSTNGEAEVPQSEDLVSDDVAAAVLENAGDLRAAPM